MTALARWKELCMDTTGGEALGRFWATVAGLGFHPDGHAGDLTGPTEGHGIAMCTVPEAKTVKHRVHLDVYAPSEGDLEALGATVVGRQEHSGFTWTVLTDPEGGEFCAFPKPAAAMPSYTVHGLIVDSADPESVARWWADVLGAELGGGAEHGWWWLTRVPGLPIDSMGFVPVPEPKTVKNRIHWDVYGDVEALRERGATLLRARDGEGSATPAGERISWDVMADPEGNEFCVFAG